MKNHVTAIMRRFTDIVASTTFLILLAPIFFFIGIFIKSVSAGPIFDRKIYKKDSNEITLFRFRTTHLDSDQLIPFGDILKISSLEELPLFLNVLKGDISLFIGLSRIKLIDYSLLEKARKPTDKSNLPIFTLLVQSLIYKRSILALGFLGLGIFYYTYKESPDLITLTICLLLVAAMVTDLILILYRYKKRIYGNNCLELFELKNFLSSLKDKNNIGGNGGKKRKFYPEKSDQADYVSDGNFAKR